MKERFYVIYTLVGPRDESVRYVAISVRTVVRLIEERKLVSFKVGRS